MHRSQGKSSGRCGMAFGWALNGFVCGFQWGMRPWEAGKALCRPSGPIYFFLFLFYKWEMNPNRWIPTIWEKESQPFTPEHMRLGCEAMVWIFWTLVANLGKLVITPLIIIKLFISLEFRVCYKRVILMAGNYSI